LFVKDTFSSRVVYPDWLEMSLSSLMIVQILQNVTLVPSPPVLQKRNTGQDLR